MEIEVSNVDRLDKYLLKILNESRNQISNYIKNKNVLVNNQLVVKAGYKLKIGDKITLLTPQTQTKPIYQVDFDIEILYEDDDILVINKPSGIIVHQAPSVKEATLVDWLKKYGISLSTISGEERHGIVHRLDKGTSGVMVVAKNNYAHQFLSAQLSNKSMGRLYLAIINQPLKEDIIIQKPIGRNKKNRLKMDVVSNGKWAKTFFKKLLLSNNLKNELILAKLYTGRTHQIRVHLKSISRYILGDDLYGFKSDFDKINRILLHAYCLYLVHPTTKKQMLFLAKLDQYFENYLEKNFIKELVDEKISKDFVSRFVTMV